MKPYLVQRGKINPDKSKGTHRISAAVALDYMGSAEFEWGALPSSLRKMYENREEYKLTKEKRIPDEQGQPHLLYVYHPFSDEDYESYFKFLFSMRMRLDEVHTKEYHDFDAHWIRHRLGKDRTDFWWDIQHGVMWTFDKKFAMNLRETLNHSWSYMKLPKWRLV